MPLRFGAAVLLVDLACLIAARFGLGWYVWDPPWAILGFHVALCVIAVAGFARLGSPPSALGLHLRDLPPRTRAFLRFVPIPVASCLTVVGGSLAGAVILHRGDLIQPPIHSPDGLWIAQFIVVHPLPEEILYRGVLHGTLRPRVGRAGAIAAGGLLFGVVHGIYGIDPVSSIAYGLGGAALAWTYERTGSLFFPWLLHVLFNLLAWTVSRNPHWLEPFVRWAQG